MRGDKVVLGLVYVIMALLGLVMASTAVDGGFVERWGRVAYILRDVGAEYDEKWRIRSRIDSVLDHVEWRPRGSIPAGSSTSVDEERC